MVIWVEVAGEALVSIEAGGTDTPTKQRAEEVKEEDLQHGPRITGLCESRDGVMQAHARHRAVENPKMKQPQAAGQ